MSDLFPPFEPDAPEPRRRRFQAIPLRLLVPNVVTLLALCAGLTGIRMAFEGRMELALGAIVIAAVLDGMDGRLARMLQGTSRFGAELDSLSDFVCFGVAPALIIFMWGLDELGSLGWIASLAFAICAGLRLARFNVMLEDPNKPPFAGDYFTGIPAPAGALIMLLPIYLELIGLPRLVVTPAVAALFTLAIALLMISKLPAFSGKRLGARIPRDKVMPLFIVVVLSVAVLVTWPWATLSVVCAAYLAALPFSAMRYARQMREFEARQVSAETLVPAEASPAAPGAGTPGEDRPSHLN